MRKPEEINIRIMVLNSQKEMAEANVESAKRNLLRNLTDGTTLDVITHGKGWLESMERGYNELAGINKELDMLQWFLSGNE